METPVVGIVGGGLAAVSAALTLKRLGLRPIVFERSSTLGGRAGTHVGRDGRVLDIGQHVYLGCCREYRALLRLLGTDHLAPLERRTDFLLIDAPSQRTARLRAAPLPYPLSLAGAIAGYGHLSLRERLKTLALIPRATRARRQGPAPGLTFADWLAEAGVPHAAIQYLWEPLILASLNATPAEVSAESALMVIADGLAGGRESASVGIPRQPLFRLLEPLPRVLGARGLVRCNSAVRSVTSHGTQAVGVTLEGDEHVACDAVLIATAHRDVGRLLPAEWAHLPYFARISRLAVRAIVNVHLWYDAPVLPKPMVGVVRSPLQWLFDLTTLHDEATHRGHHVAVSLSGADELMKRPAGELARSTATDMARTFPAAARARLIDTAVRKMGHATFSCAPGDETLRPGNLTPVRRLFLAGDYTATGWPSTMESAVISGRLAAEAIAREISFSPE